MFLLEKLWFFNLMKKPHRDYGENNRLVLRDKPFVKEKNPDHFLANLFNHRFLVPIYQYQSYDSYGHVIRAHPLSERTRLNIALRQAGYERTAFDD